MVELLGLSLGLLVAGVEFVALQDSVLGRLLVSEARGEPTIVFRELNEPGLVAIRLSIRAEDPPGLEGAGRVLQLLSRDHLLAEAEALGAKLEVSRSPSHLIYSIVGPSGQFPGMAGIIRRATERPALSPQGLAVARALANREAAADMETPDRLVRRRLQSALFPLLRPPSGEAETIAALEADDLEWYWARSFRPEAFVLVIVGRADPETVFSTFRRWPDPPNAPRAPPRVPIPGLRSGTTLPEVIHPWAGVGYVVTNADPVVLTVAAALIDERLATLGLSAAHSEIWWGADRLGLTLVGGAGNGQADGANVRISELLEAAIPAALTGATPTRILTIRRSLYGKMLLRGRSPDGLAELIGELADRTGDPTGIESFLARLATIQPGPVRTFLRSLLNREPTVVEVIP